MQNVEHCDNKKLESKVCGSASVPTTSKATTAKYNPSGNGKNNMSAAEVTSNNRFVNSSPSPAKSDLELYTEMQPRVLDTSESDEESVSEVRCTFFVHFLHISVKIKNKIRRRRPIIILIS